MMKKALKDFVKGYLVYFIGTYAFYGISCNALNAAKYYHDIKSDESKKSEYKMGLVVAEACKNFKKAFKLLC